MRLKLQFVPVLAALLAVALLALNLSRSRQTGSAQAAAPNEEQAELLPFHHNDSTNSPANPTPSSTPEITVPAGTELEVCMRSPLSSATASPGEHFEAMLQEPLAIDGKIIAPSGANVIGQVVAVRHSGKLHELGYLRITLVSLDLNGQPVSLSTSSFFVQGASYKKPNWALIGAGASSGALASDGKGALIGGAAGAGPGTGAALTTRKKDVVIEVERHVTFRLTQPLVTHG